MKKQSKSNQKKIHLTQSVKQKHTLRNIAIASSVLGCTALAFAIINFSSHDESLASGQVNYNQVNYRSTEIDLHDRLLDETISSNKSEKLNYKGQSSSQKLILKSRATDLLVKEINDTKSE